MAEYVMEYDGWAEGIPIGEYLKVRDAMHARKREQVVRCRDCKFYTPESMTREERGFGVYENMWEPGGCFNPERCSATWDSIAGQMVPVGIVTEPDGFCAWASRKESE